jgi:glutaredoxin
VSFQYIDVTRDRAGLERMLGHSKGDRTVPVIVEGGRVQIGWHGEG